VRMNSSAADHTSYYRLDPDTVLQSIDSPGLMKQDLTPISSDLTPISSFL